MGLLHRHDESVRDEDARESATDRDQYVSEPTHRRSGFHPFARDEAAREDAARRDAIAERDLARHERDEAELDREERVHMKRWDLPSFLTAAAAVALAVVGGLALVRTGVDDTWYSPVEEVARIDHTAALGAIEVGVAALVLITLLVGLRMVAALVAIAGGVVAAVAAIDPEEISADLALERGWATALAVAGILLGLLLVASRDRVKRVERRPGRAHRLARGPRTA